MNQLDKTIIHNKNVELRNNIEKLYLLRLVVLGLSVCFCIICISINPEYKLELLGIVMVLAISYSLLMVVSQYTENPYYSSFLDFIS